LQTIGEMPVSTRIMTYEGDKQDGSPPIVEALVAVTCIFLQLSHHRGKHYERPFGGETSHKIRPRQVSSGHR